MVVPEYFSNLVEVYAIQNQEAVIVAQTLADNRISLYGVPIELHSDQGRNFGSTVFSEMCKILNMQKTIITPLHPQSDGMVERFNRTLEDFLKKTVADQMNWERMIPLFLLDSSQLNSMNV